MPPQSASSGSGDSANIASASSAEPATEQPLDLRAYWLLVLMGAGLLTPWNVVLNALPFFIGLYSVSGGPGGSPASSYPFLVSSVYSWPAVPVLFAMVFFGDRVSLRTRIVGSFAAQAAIMALTPVVAPWSSYAPLALMFLNGLCTGLLQSSLFGLCAPFPPIYAQGMMLGQGFAGALSSYAQIAVLAAAAAAPGRSNAATAAYAYFATAAAVMVACGAAYLALVRLPSAQRYLRGAGSGGGGGGAALVLVDDSAEGASGEAAAEAGVELLRAGARDGAGAEDGDEGGEGGSGSKRPLLSGGSGGGGGVDTAQSGVFAVLRAMWPQALALFLVFFMTFLVFPGLTIAIPYHGSNAALAATGNWGIGMLAVFNTFDTVGRFLPGRVLFLRPSWLLPASLLRFALVPLFLACVRGWAPAALFGADAFSVALVAVFAAGNGYVASSVFMLTPPLVRERDQERAGFLLSLLLNLGITLGAQAALVFTA